MMASKNTSDSKGQEIFASLAKEEMDHLKFLKMQYDSFLEKGQFNEKASLPVATALSPDKSIFSDDIKNRIKDAHYEMTALSIAIQLELSAINFYRQESNAHSDNAVKSFYKELADWESKHYQMLLNQQNLLKEDYWDAGGFSPY